VQVLDRMVVAERLSLNTTLADLATVLGDVTQDRNTWMRHHKLLSAASAATTVADVVRAHRAEKQKNLKKQEAMGRASVSASASRGRRKGQSSQPPRKRLKVNDVEVSDDVAEIVRAILPVPYCIHVFGRCPSL
jgi:hypothetical protein